MKKPKKKPRRLAWFERAEIAEIKALIDPPSKDDRRNSRRPVKGNQ